ncbi:MAG: threonine/serine exporter ThrE family protein [Prevotella sp.]
MPSRPTDSRDDLMYRMDLLLQTGKVLMESAADTNRVIRNMRRVAVWLRLPETCLQLYVTYNMVMANVVSDGRSYTKFQRCERHGINMDVLAGVSRLSWQALREDWPTDRYEAGLEEIRYKRRHFTPWQVAIGAGFACGGFCVQFGCDWVAFFYASVAAMLGFRLRGWLGERGCHPLIGVGMAAFFSTLMAWLCAMLSIRIGGCESCPQLVRTCMQSATPWHPLMACSLFIVPGVPLINFVCDMLDGYVQTGITRAVGTLLIVLAMSFGIAFAIQLLGIDNFVRDLSMTPHHSYNEYMLAAAVSAIGFSMIFNTPRHLWWVVAVGGMVAVCARNLVSLGADSGNIGLGMGPVVGSFVGSALASLLCTRVVHVVHVPHHCISIPSVIPMIPGVLMYRALFGFIDMHGVVGEVTVAMNNAIRASLIILFIAMGVAIPNIFVRRLLRK